MLAVAVPPVIGTGSPPPITYVADTLPVMLFFDPTLVPVTATENEHELEAARFRVVMPIVLPPAFAVILPVQLPLRLLGVATTKPRGKVSVTETLFNVNAAFGFTNVKVRVVVSLSWILAALNAFVIVGLTGAELTVTTVAGDGALEQPFVVDVTV